MARAMWRGAIQFGLVTIPVKLYLATESQGHQLQHAPQDGPVPDPDEDLLSGRRRGHLARRHGQGLRVRARPVRRDHRRGPRDGPAQDRPLDRDRAVHPADPVDDGAVKFVKQAYYIEPDQIGRKAFYLLKDVLEDKGLTAICKVVIKDREALAAIDPFAKTMLLTTLHWPDEIRALGELDLPAEEPEIKPAERKMAEQLVEAMTGEFDPADYQRRVPRGAAQGHRGQGRRRGDRRGPGGRAGHQPGRPDGGPRGERQGRRRRPRDRASRPPVGRSQVEDPQDGRRPTDEAEDAKPARRRKSA